MEHYYELPISGDAVLSGEGEIILRYPREGRIVYTLTDAPGFGPDLSNYSDNSCVEMEITYERLGWVRKRVQVAIFRWSLTTDKLLHYEVS